MIKSNFKSQKIPTLIDAIYMKEQNNRLPLLCIYLAAAIQVKIGENNGRKSKRHKGLFHTQILMRFQSVIHHILKI